MTPVFEGFDSLLQRSKVLMQNRYGPKVIAMPDGEIMKLFRRKRLLSSALWNPYSRRFAKNAADLKKLGVPTVEVTGLWKILSPKRDAVVYRRLEGECLRDLELTEERAGKLADFIAGLHAKGVFFRSVHFGNILELPDGNFGLIDMADLACKGRPLTVAERLRNMRHLMKYKIDRDALETSGIDGFLNRYGKSSGLPERSLETFHREVRRRLEASAG